ncbi:beta-glucosidase [Achromobacter aloeverae]|uniref:Beta-glucosidase n=1 Tax=Achromobacter aloeverae TaxID=1750518 RepID=A0A4Q1HIQ5_9BURK|nr:beta-glucosidase [Achromobacter aloeverae]RXN88088.1 beta-glucosidase [Achromobacter aloeverae]
MQTPYASFMQGGFECSCLRFSDGRQLDMIAATGHDRHASRDYGAMALHGIRSVRDGLRWHLIGASPNSYDWSSLRPLVAAANEHDIQVTWDLCHYGWPAWLDIWSARFPEAFARYAAAAARTLGALSRQPPLYSVMNEISFWSWAGGQMGNFGPTETGRGADLKRQLARAAIQASEAILEVDARARLVAPEPLIAVHPGEDGDVEAARAHHDAQYEAWDMLCGRIEPELGGSAALLDIVGVNFYPYNQWRLDGPTVRQGEPAYRPLRELLGNVHRRYGRPIVISETGAEGVNRPGWLQYVADEVAAAMRAGVPMAGICLYPVTDYPGWEDGRHCPTGLLGLASETGERPVCVELAATVLRLSERFRLQPCVA